MARSSLTRSLAHLLTPHSSTSSTTRLVSLRYQSTFDKDAVAVAKEKMEKVAMKKLEDAVHRIIVKRAEPGWMPFVPGGSYWVPPRSKARGFSDVVGRLVVDVTSAREVVKDDDKSLALDSSSNRGWPSSAQFFKGTSHSPLEGEIISKHTSKTEEEEG